MKIETRERIKSIKINVKKAGEILKVNNKIDYKI